MLILEHNVLEVILLAFMDQLQPFLNGKFGFYNYCFCTGLSQEYMRLCTRLTTLYWITWYVLQHSG